VDGYNVIQVVLLGGEDRDGWWRAPARQKLIDRARELPPERGRIWLVFDGSDPAAPVDEASPGPHLVFAPSADEWIARRVRATAPHTTVVVTADRRLAGRCRHAGARVVAPSEFIAACRATDEAHEQSTTGD